MVNPEPVNLVAIYKLTGDVLNNIRDGETAAHPSTIEQAQASLASVARLLVPKWEGEFVTFGDWVNTATRKLTGRRGSMGQPLPAVCVDMLGRRCNIGSDFQRARDEDAFPIRFFWEMQTLASRETEV